MIELIEFIVKELVDRKEKVSVEIKPDGEAEVVLIHVDPSDIGKIIGKQGRIVTAIRTVVKAVGMKKGIHYTVEIVDNKE